MIKRVIQRNNFNFTFDTTKIIEGSRRANILVYEGIITH